ncbi:MAG: PAS domain-containing protein [Myxococcales bacterium]|nr:PAS domain-containing protein [Myxococcales bacterium]
MATAPLRLEPAPTVGTSCGHATTPDAFVLLTDVMGRLQWANRSYSSHFGPAVEGDSIEAALGLEPTSTGAKSLAEWMERQHSAERVDRSPVWEGVLECRGSDGRSHTLHCEFERRNGRNASTTGFAVTLTEEPTLENSAELRAVALDNLGEGVVLLRGDGTIVDCNRAAEEILGTKRDVLLSLNAFDSHWNVSDLHGKRLAVDQRPAYDVITNGRSHRNLIVGFQTPDRGRRWISESAEPWRSRSGEVIGVISSFSDVTEAFQIQNRLEVVVDGAGLGTWDWNVMTGHCAFNDQWGRMLGYEPSEITQHVSSWERLVHPDDLPAALAAVRSHLSGESSSYRSEHRLRRRDGSWTWILDTGRIIERSFDGQALRVAGVHVDINANKELEAQLREAHERYQAATDGTSDGLFDIEVDTGRFWLSERGWRLLGHAGAGPEGPLGLDLVRRAIHGDDFEALRASIKEHGQAGTPFGGDVRIRSNLGEYRWFRVQGSSRPSPSGGIRLSGTVQDVHVRRTAEEQRDRNFQQSLDLLCLADYECRLRQVNPAWTRVLGWTAQELVGRYISDFLHPDDLARSYVQLGAVIFGKPMVAFECRLRTASGGYRLLSWNGTPDSETWTSFCVVRDVTHAHEQARAMAANAAMLKEAQTAGRIGCWSIDLKSGLVTWTRQVYHLLGVPEAEGPISIERAQAAFPQAEQERLGVLLRSTIARGGAFRAVVNTTNGADGVRFVRGEGRVGVDAKGDVTSVMGTIMDVTAEVEREQALRDAQGQAEAASRAKSEFLANMSHEIRTPLTAIIGFAEILANDKQQALPSDAWLGYADTIRRNGEHLLSLINDILDLSKIEAGQLTTESVALQPRALVDDVLELVAMKALARGNVIRVAWQEATPSYVRSDPVRLRQVLVNIVGNAVKFTEKGRIDVKVGYAESTQRLVIAVADTGIGLTREQLSRLFGAFVQADSGTTRRFGGTGLGLRISRRLAQMLGGDITVQSEPGVGSTFVVSVMAPAVYVEPRFDEPGSHPGVEPRRFETPSGVFPRQLPLQDVRVLVAEDGPDNLQLITFHLKKAGAIVNPVENGVQAIEAVTADGTLDGKLADIAPYDLVLTDIQMPEMDGFETTRRLRLKGWLGPIIALTASAMAGDRERCLNAGCDAYASKPIDRDELIDVCRRSLVRVGR